MPMASAMMRSPQWSYGVTKIAYPQACGSGGTTAGLALGNELSGMGATIHAYGVCDDEEYFYDFIDGIYKDLGATPDRVGKAS